MKQALGSTAGRTGRPLALEIRRSYEIALGEELIKWFGEVDVVRVSR